MAKFLIIRFSSIGDIVLTSPVVRVIKNQIPNAEVHYATKKQYNALIENNPYIDKIHLLENNLLDFIDILKEENFDYVIDLHNSLRSRMVRYKLPAKSFAVNKINFAKWLMVNTKINILPKKHIVDRYLETLKHFKITNDNHGLDYYIPITDEIRQTELMSFCRNGYIAFVIGAKHNTKRLTKEKIISICKQIKYPIIFLGGYEDADLGDEIAEKIGSNALNGCGEYTINQSASIIKYATFVITHDTGLMHIASAFNKDIISIWGNTIPDFGMYPYTPQSETTIIEVEKLRCRPCSKIGFDKCPKKHFKCMKNIDEDKIIRTVNKLLLKHTPTQKSNSTDSK